ncbi:hypothetical protein CZ797_18650 [Pseudoalteromonas sp. JB197]|nr:hypothetical protein CZ797_18650 [Pseudoalteromonas sp. JB197]
MLARLVFARPLAEHLLPLPLFLILGRVDLCGMKNKQHEDKV